MRISFFSARTLAVGVAALSVANVLGQTVVDFPASENHEDYIEVYRTVVDGRQTVLEGTVYNLPGYWVRLSSSGKLYGGQTGKAYRMLKTEGFEMDKQVVMPDSGCCDFKLYFEPVDARDRTVHWIERGNDTLFTALCVRPVPPSGDVFACRIKGTVEGKRCVRLLLYDFDQDQRVRPALSIPVRSNRFDYTCYTDKPQVKLLTRWEEYVDGAWYVMPLFIEKGENEISILPESQDVDLHRATAANYEWKSISRESDSLERESRLDELYGIMKRMTPQQALTPEALLLEKQLRAFYEKMEKLPDDEALRDSVQLIYRQRSRLETEKKMFTPEYTRIRSMADSITMQLDCRLADRLADTPSLPALFRLYQLTDRSVANKSPEMLHFWQIYQKHFAPLWGESPLGKHLEAILQAEMQIRAGEDYPLFEARDLNGQLVSVNGLIKGKWALIDLWASWCGPCRAQSKQMIPVYNQYADKGFTVVGIARERKVSDALEAIRKDGYPWMQLVELHDEMGIWLRHGIKNAGGSTFLVNPEGKIVAVKPSAAEVEAILKEHLIP